MFLHLSVILCTVGGASRPGGAPSGLQMDAPPPQKAGGTHPTGMHTCWPTCLLTAGEGNVFTSIGGVPTREGVCAYYCLLGECAYFSLLGGVPTSAY